MYVKGEALYIHLHQFSSKNGWMTPSKIRIKIIRVVKHMDAIGGVGDMDAIACPNVV